MSASPTSFEPSEGDTQALLEANWKWNTILAGLVETDVLPLVRAAATERRDPASQAILVLLLRVLAWMKTAEKLRDPSDFQAVATCVRALFEISVDLTLLHYDRIEYPMSKFIAWAESARWKSAAAAKRFSEKAGPPLLPMLPPMLDFFSRHESRIRALRQAYWPGKPKKGQNPNAATKRAPDEAKGEHPPRWTGRDLGQDAERADSLSPRRAAEFYNLQYSWICWYVHGSGLAGIAGMEKEAFPQFMVFSLWDIARFATNAAELALKYVGQWNQAMIDLFSTLAQRQKGTVASIYTAHPARTTLFPR